VQLLHQGTAFGLVKLEPLIGRQIQLSGDRIMMVDRRQGLQDETAFFRETRRHFDETTAAVSKAVGRYGFKLSAAVTCQCVTHLYGGIRAGRPAFQRFGRINLTAQVSAQFFQLVNHRLIQFP